MADPQVVSTLTRKRDEIERAIATYEKKLTQARFDLAHVNATLRLFKVTGEASEFPVYVDVHRLFRRGEIVTLCKAAIAEEGPLDTRELAYRVLRAKGFDENDGQLRISVAFRIVQAMRLQAKRGGVSRHSKRKGVMVWCLPT